MDTKGRMKTLETEQRRTRTGSYKHQKLMLIIDRESAHNSPEHFNDRMSIVIAARVIGMYTHVHKIYGACLARDNRLKFILIKHLYQIGRDDSRETSKKGS